MSSVAEMQCAGVRQSCVVAVFNCPGLEAVILYILRPGIPVSRRRLKGRYNERDRSSFQRETEYERIHSRLSWLL